MPRIFQNTTYFNLLANGLANDGCYKLKREGHAQPLEVLFSGIADPTNPDSPVAIIMHGYRGSPVGDNNVAVQDIFQRNGFATAQVAFAGYDHYGHEAAPRSADSATFESNVEDIDYIMGAIGSTRPVVLLANSASINIAVPVSAQHENVSHIIGVSPFPNLVPYVGGVLKHFDALPPENGFVIPHDRMPQFSPMIKITDTFLRSGQLVDLFDVAHLKDMPYKPKLMTARAQNDQTVPDGYVDRWLDAMRAAGYQVDDAAVRNCDDHELTGDVLKQLERQVKLALQDIGGPGLGLVS